MVVKEKTVFVLVLRIRRACLHGVLDFTIQDLFKDISRQCFLYKRIKIKPEPV